MIKGKDLMVWLAAPLLIVSLLFLMSAGGSISATAPTDWYFTPNQEHRRPEVNQSIPLESYPVLYCGSEEEKKVALTFDAGYDNGHHTEILQTLRQKKAPAAFFFDGNFLKANGALVKEIAADGHIIGNHSLHHSDMTALTDLGAFRAEIEGWEAELQALGIAPSGYFRFPCGRYSERALDYAARLDQTIVFWSFAYYDWVQQDQPQPAAALQKIMSRMHNGCVLLLHSTSATNASILGALIDQLRAEGYTLVSLDQMMQK